MIIIKRFSPKIFTTVFNKCILNTFYTTVLYLYFYKIFYIASLICHIKRFYFFGVIVVVVSFLFSSFFFMFSKTFSCLLVCHLAFNGYIFNSISYVLYYALFPPSSPEASNVTFFFKILY